MRCRDCREELKVRWDEKDKTLFIIYCPNLNCGFWAKAKWIDEKELQGEPKNELERTRNNTNAVV